MDAAFWQTRWQRGETGFHKSRVNPLLRRWWPALQLPASARVYVPLCGKSLDLLWLREQGHEVLGVELARVAIESFISEHALTLDWQPDSAFEVAAGAGFEFLCGDVFDLGAERVADVAAVYDRAALIALPPDMRAAYAAHTQAILPPGWKMLLVTLDYPQEQRAGPPFSVPDAQVRTLFSDCRIELLDEQDVLADHAIFASQGMDKLVERVYLIQH